MPTIRDRSPAFQGDHDARRECLALMEGLAALKRDADPTGEQLWAWPGPGEMRKVESSGKKLLTAYQAKIKAGRLENVWLRSLKATASVPFTASPQLSGWPASMANFARSCDDQGRDIGAYWASLFLWKLAAGVDYTLVDLPREVGGSAYWAGCRASAVLDVRTSTVNGKTRPLEARIVMQENVPAELGTDPAEWTQPAAEERVRIYRVAELLGGQVDADEADILGGRVPVHFREAARRKVGEELRWTWVTPWTPLEARSGVFTEVPLVPHYASDVGPYRGRPPFADTASEQMALWRKTLDFDARESRDSTHTPVIKGAKPGDVVFDGRAIYLLKPDADAVLLETTGAALEQLRKGRDEIKQSIRIGNLRPIMSQPTPSRTATEIMVYELSASSVLEMWVLMDLASLRQALVYVALLNGDVPSAEASIDIPHDYSLSPEAMKMIWDGWVAGGGKPPDALVWREARRHGWISEREKPDVLAKESADETAAIEVDDLRV